MWDSFHAKCRDHMRPPKQKENIPKSYRTKDGKVSSLLDGVRGNTKVVMTCNWPSKTFKTGQRAYYFTFFFITSWFISIKMYIQNWVVKTFRWGYFTLDRAPKTEKHLYFILGSKRSHERSIENSSTFWCPWPKKHHFKSSEVGSVRKAKRRYLVQVYPLTQLPA